MLKIGHAAVDGISGHEAGRRLLVQMYRQETGQAPPDIVLLPRGKPHFVGDPLYFSISHTPRHVFCALSDRPIGIDAEELDRPIKAALAEKILSPAEYRRFCLCSDRRLALLRFWVLKEALVKCGGQGLRGYPNHTDFHPDDPRIQIRDGCLVAVIQQEEPHAF